MLLNAICRLENGEYDQAIGPPLFAVKERDASEAIKQEYASFRNSVVNVERRACWKNWLEYNTRWDGEIVPGWYIYTVIINGTPWDRYIQIPMEVR